MLFVYLFVLVLGVILLSSAIRILKEYERGIVSLGRVLGTSKGPGLTFLIPIIDNLRRRQMCRL